MNDHRGVVDPVPVAQRRPDDEHRHQLRRRHDDVNMRSAWMCSLNDVAGNAGVIVAGAAVALTASGWPDILVGLMIAGMFCASATHIIRAAAARPA